MKTQEYVHNDFKMCRVIAAEVMGWEQCATSAMLPKATRYDCGGWWWTGPNRDMADDYNLDREWLPQFDVNPYESQRVLDKLTERWDIEIFSMSSSFRDRNGARWGLVLSNDDLAVHTSSGTSVYGPTSITVHGKTIPEVICKAAITQIGKKNYVELNENG